MNKNVYLSGLSIVICTYNRATLLSNLIDYFDNKIIVVKNLNFELVIVDNNSLDNTKEVVRERIGVTRYYELKYTMETNPGLSAARNKGVYSSQYEYIFFLDDDAVPNERFLIYLNEAIEAEPTVKAFCCKVKSYYKKMPSWLKYKGKYSLPVFGNYDLGNTSRYLTLNDPVPIGSSIILKKEIFDTYGNFNTEIGYNYKRFMLIPGEDTVFLSKIIYDNNQVYYISKCEVSHYPSKDKISVKKFTRIFLGKGFFEGGLDFQKEKNKSIIIFFPIFYYKEILYTASHSIIRILILDFSKSIFYYLYFCKILGRMYGYYRKRMSI